MVFLQCLKGRGEQCSLGNTAVFGWNRMHFLQDSPLARL